MRDNSIDIVKGIAIILVLYGHVLLKIEGNGSSWVLDFIYSFHMPIFFIISGIFENPNNTIRNFIIKRIKNIIYPYFVFSIISIVISFIKFKIGIEGIESVIEKTMSFISFNGFGVLWFLPTLFFGELLFITIRKSLKHYSTLLSFVLFIFCYYLHDNFDIIPDLFFRPIIALFYINIGYEFRRIRGCRVKTPWKLLFTIVIILNFYLSKNLGFSDVHFIIINNLLFFIYLSISTSLMLLYICRGISCRLLQYFGQNSLSIMLTHHVLPILSISLFIGKYFNYSLNILVSMIFMLIFEYIIIIMINKFCPWVIKM